MDPLSPNPGPAVPATPATDNCAAIPADSLGLAASIHAPTQSQPATPADDSAVPPSHSHGLAASMHAPASTTAAPPGPPAAPPLLSQPSWNSPVMDFDPMAGSGGGGNTGGFNSGFNSSFFPFPINTFPGPPLGPTAAPHIYSPQSTFAPPQDGWQTAYQAAVSAQDIYRERVRELSSHNAELQSERDSLRQEITALRQQTTQAEHSPWPRETDATSRSRYSPYNAETRRNGSAPFPRVTQTRDDTRTSDGLSARTTARSTTSDADRMDTDPPRYMFMAPLGPVTEEELRRTSLRARRGRPDPSVEKDPHSAWYEHFRARGPPERLPDDTPWLRDLRLPVIAFRAMGPDADHAEAGRVANARIQRDLEAGPESEATRTPLRQDYQPPDLRRWGSVTIITVIQAHNLRHWAIYGHDIYAARLYRHLNSLYQSDPTLHRSEGIRYLLAAFSADSHRLPFERSATSSLRRADRKRAAAATRRANNSSPSPSGVTSGNTGNAAPSSQPPISPSSSPTPVVSSTPAVTSAPTTIASSTAPTASSPEPPSHLVTRLPHIPAAIAPSEAWQTRALSGANRDLSPTMRSSDAIRAFANIPTSRWPIGMRDDHGDFPPRSSTTFRSPLAADVYAEVFLSSIIPAVPDGLDEQFGESSFFRGLIEVFSLPPIYPWVMEQGQYDQLLVEEPSPYPYDCTALGIHHVVAWARSCGIDQEPDLRAFVHAYAANTRCRLEGREGTSSSSEPFLSHPARASDIIRNTHAPLIPSYETLFAGTPCSYEDSEPATNTAATPTTAGTTSLQAASPAPEDVDMTPAPAMT